MTDPVEVFPSEVLSPLFSLFNNQELQILSSISKSWRNQILTDVIIHRILDLTEIKRNLSEDEIIEIVKRLASLSSYPRNEIRLLLQPFWKTFEKLLTSDTTSDQWSGQMKAIFNKFGSLLSAIASSTKGKLSGLHLSLGSSQAPKGGSAAIFASAILERVFTLAKLMKELDSISLKVPLPVSLDSEGKNGSKRFRIIGDENDGGEASWRFVPFMALIRRTIDFTGFGLTGLGIDLDRFPCLPTGQIDFDAVEKIFKQVNASSSVLRALTLYGLESADVSQHALDIVSKCPNLSSLTLLLKGDPNQQKQLVFTKHSSTSSLVKLNITLYRLNLDWNSSLLLGWIGSRLKILWIDQGGSPAQLPLEALKSILNQNPLLEIVSIQESNISISSIRSTANSLNLPHLKELTLGKFDHVQELVAGASIADLRVLRLYPRCSTGTVQRGSAISHFLPIFECCHKTIEYLWTGDMYAPVLSVPDANAYNQLDDQGKRRWIL